MVFSIDAAMPLIMSRLVTLHAIAAYHFQAISEAFADGFPSFLPDTATATHAEIFLLLPSWLPELYYE